MAIQNGQKWLVHVSASWSLTITAKRCTKRCHMALCSHNLLSAKSSCAEVRNQKGDLSTLWRLSEPLLLLDYVGSPGCTDWGYSLLMFVTVNLPCPLRIQCIALKKSYFSHATNDTDWYQITFWLYRCHSFCKQKHAVFPSIWPLKDVSA